ncbi:MAG: hypothetical protein FWC26_11245 [Fibromonadales bacterium]|nr:hypothetical protein [Fibromonadales bacterium]
MRKINIRAVKDGMVLAEPLKNANGSLLLDKGTPLTSFFATRLGQRGVTTVCVEGEPEPGDEASSVVQAAETQTIQLEELFSEKIINNSMRIIYDALIKIRNQNG